MRLPCIFVPTKSVVGPGLPEHAVLRAVLPGHCCMRHTIAAMLTPTHAHTGAPGAAAGRVCAASARPGVPSRGPHGVSGAARPRRSLAGAARVGSSGITPRTQQQRRRRDVAAGAGLWNMPEPKGLVDMTGDAAKDACGVGFVAQLSKGASRAVVTDALKMLARMSHRGACGCEENTGAALRQPHMQGRASCLPPPRCICRHARDRPRRPGRR